MHQWSSIKRLLLYTVIGTLVLAALVGIYAFLFGRFGETEIRILLTTLAISYFSVTSLACAAAFENRLAVLLAVPGLIVSIAGLCLFVPTLWADWFRYEAISKTLAILAVFSFSLAQACLLSLVTLEEHLIWIRYTTVVCILFLAGIISAMIIIEPEGGWAFRVAGAVGIVDGCLSLCIPVLHRLKGGQTIPIRAMLWRDMEIPCPRCGHRGTYPIGLIQCRHCSLRIRVQVEDDSP